MDKIEHYIFKKEHWRKELELLRSILTNLPVEETIKWGAPTYVFQGKNIVGLAAFKNYCGLWFFQGALLKDRRKVLYNAQENKTKAMLQWRFYSVDEIDAQLIEEYVLEAIENVKKGNEIKPIRNKKPLVIPIELKQFLSDNLNLKNNFEKFSLFKQREFADYVSSAKREKTKETRLEKIKPLILNNIGLNDKYKKC